MKRCPTCQQVFFDDALSFCTDDGSILEPDETGSATPPTAVNPDPMATMISPSGSIPGYTPPTFAEPPAPGSSGYGSAPSGSGASWGASQPSGGPLTPDWSNPAPTPSWEPPPPPGYGSVAQQPSQGLAIASLVLGLCSITIGLCCYLGVLLSPAAIITGIISLVQIKNDPEKNTGKVMAIVGIVSGALYWVVLVLMFVLWGAASLLNTPR
jgi:hypothetical protein